jgi:hypothetical protein
MISNTVRIFVFLAIILILINVLGGSLVFDDHIYLSMNNILRPENAEAYKDPEDFMEQMKMKTETQTDNTTSNSNNDLRIASSNGALTMPSNTKSDPVKLNLEPFQSGGCNGLCGI